MTRSLGSSLRAGESMVGTFVATPTPMLGEMLAAQFDVLVVDLEHSALTVGDVQAVAIAAQGASCHVAVRIPDLRWDGLTAVLDAGVDGVVAPRVDSPAQARELVDRLSYPPAGARGYGPRRANRYGCDPDYWRTAGERLACIAQIESRAGLAAAGEIAAVPGIDCLLLGPADLSFELGCPLDMDADELRGAARSVARAAHDAGVAYGVASNVSPPALKALVEEGLSLLVQGVDLRIYATAAARLAGDARAALGAATAHTDPAIPTPSNPNAQTIASPLREGRT